MTSLEAARTQASAFQSYVLYPVTIEIRHALGRVWHTCTTSISGAMSRPLMNDLSDPRDVWSCVGGTERWRISTMRKRDREDWYFLMRERNLRDVGSQKNGESNWSRLTKFLNIAHKRKIVSAHLPTRFRSSSEVSSLADACWQHQIIRGLKQPETISTEGKC